MWIAKRQKLSNIRCLPADFISGLIVVVNLSEAFPLAWYGSQSETLMDLLPVSLLLHEGLENNFEE